MIKTRVILCSALTAAALFSGAAGAESFTFWHGATGKLGEALQLICDEYNHSQNVHTVSCVGQGGNEILMQKAIASFRTKTNPELILGYDAGTLDLMLSGAIIPAEELKGGPGGDKDYIRSIRAYYEGRDGKLFAQPFNASTLLLFSNMEQLKAAGVQTPPQTWEEFQTAAQKIKDAGHQCPFVTDGHSWRFLEEYSAVAGEPVASEGNGYESLNARYVFEKTSHPRMMKDLVEWRKKGLVKLNADTRAGNYTAAFSSGECTMMLNSSAAYGQVHLALKDKTQVQVSMMPVYEGVQRHNTTVGGGALWVMKGHSSEKYAAVADFLNYAIKPETQYKYVKRTGYLPVTQAGYNYILDSEDASSPEFATVKISIDSLNQPSTKDTRGIRLGFFTQFRQAWAEEMQKVYTGSQTVEQALENARKKGDNLLSRFSQTYKAQELP